MYFSTDATMHLSGLDKQRTIGFLTASIHIGASRRLWRGVVDAATRHNVNLVCFPGGLHVSDEFEAQRNVIYDLVNRACLDGLISWSSTITGSLDPVDFACHICSTGMMPSDSCCGNLTTFKAYPGKSR
jgi:hypothetical protein